MAGWDTLRGVSFQHAVAITGALDLVADSDGLAIQVEGAADIIDLLIRTATDRRAVQARSRAEPGSWPPSELVEPIRAWIASVPDASETFEFVSDAPLSRDSALKFVPALEHVRDGRARPDEAELLEKFELPLDRDLLGRISFQTRIGGTSQLLANAVLRVATLLQSGVPEAEDAVARLFQLIAVTGGSSDPTERTLSRAQLSEALGIDVQVLDSGEGWNTTLREVYRRAALEADHDPWSPGEPAVTSSGLELDLQIAHEGESGMRFGPSPTTRQLEQGGEFGLVGPAGSGKSTTLRLLSHRGLESGGLPFLVSLASYTAGDLLPRIDRLISRRSGRRVRPGIAEAALRSSGARLLLDGLTGLDSSGRTAVLNDVRQLRERVPELMIAAVDRDAAVLRRLGLTLYFLEGLDREQRSILAGSIVGSEEAEQILREIEAQLPEAASNPLLLTMALRLWHDGDAANTRMALYGAAVEVLRGRSDATLSDGVLELITRVALRLVREGYYEADRYWWLVAMRDEMETVSAEGLFDLDVTTGEAALEAGRAIGLLQASADGSAISFLHDSFRDYLVARALERDLTLIPTLAGPSWEPALKMLAEVTGVTPTLSEAALASVPLAALVAPLDRDQNGDRASESPQLVRELLIRHTGRWPDGLDAEQLAVFVTYTPEYRYVVLASCETPGAELVDLDRMTKIALTAPFQCAVPATVGPLALAFCVWRELLAATTSSLRTGGPQLLPSSDEGIVELVTSDFRLRQEALARLASELFPTFADRIVDEIGWHGLRARLLPAVDTGLGPGFMTSSRMLAYDTRTSDVDVAIAANGESDADRGDLPQRSEIDGYLQSSPEGSALAALVDQLEKVAPRIDWRHG